MSCYLCATNLLKIIFVFFHLCAPLAWVLLSSHVPYLVCVCERRQNQVTVCLNDSQPFHLRKGPVWFHPLHSNTGAQPRPWPMTTECYNVTIVTIWQHCITVAYSPQSHVHKLYFRRASLAAVYRHILINLEAAASGTVSNAIGEITEAAASAFLSYVSCLLQKTHDERWGEQLRSFGP